MFAFTSKIFFILLDVVISAVLIGLGFIILAVILYTLICLVKGMVKHEIDDSKK